ncbi:MAG TPA: hypothetical protein VF268_00560 [Gammaproteobacteria bacterium]
MIYVAEKDFNRQLDLLEHFSNSEDVELVVWMYPEAEIDELLGLKLYESRSIKAEPVTTYQEGIISRCTKRLPTDRNLIQKLRSERHIITKNCDSICLYFSNDFEWQVCVVGHEGMGLVRNTSFISDLKKSGYNVSLNPPDWW